MSSPQTILGELRRPGGPPALRQTELSQGKTTRWCIAWSFAREARHRPVPILCILLVMHGRASTPVKRTHRACARAGGGCGPQAAEPGARPVARPRQAVQQGVDDNPRWVGVPSLLDVFIHQP